MELPPNLRLISSKDGSLNAFNAHFGEHYANMGEGAFSEKLGKHIAPAWEFLRDCFGSSTEETKTLESKALDFASLTALPDSNLPKSKTKPKQPAPTESSVRVLDLCLGLGYTALLSRALATLCNSKTIEPRHIHITSIEQDRDVLKLVGAIHGLDSVVLARLAAGECVQIGDFASKSSAQGGISLRILWGDVREQLECLLKQAHENPKLPLEHKIPESNALADFGVQDDFGRESWGKESAFDIIYQDPFSYEKCPNLWDREHFSMLYALSKPHCLITSYATRREILLAAYEAGFLAYRYKAPRQIISELLGVLGESLDREVVYKRSSSVFSKQPLNFGDPQHYFLG